MSPQPAVLVVDDVRANLVALEAELSRLDCEILCASSGNEALKRLLERDCAVMLLDVQMPEMDGFEVARFARHNPDTCDVPIVFVTAMHETEDNSLRGYGAGAIDVLFKPVHPQILRSKVQVFLDLYLGRQRLAEELEAHRQTLQELEAFTYSVSHDLRAPLRPLEGFSRYLLQNYGERLDVTGRDYLDRIRASAVKMGTLIEDLMLLSNMGRRDMQRRAVNLHVAARAIIGELRSSDPDRDVELVTSGESTVTGDAGLLHIALDNLLRNAWKFTRRRGQAHIELGIRRERDRWVCHVSDDGAGFDAARAAQLFQPFRRLHSAEDFEGNGIGLAIVQRIVDRHGGEVWAEGEPDRGATIYFTIRGR